MILRIALFALVAGGIYFSWDNFSGYSRVVDRPPDEVARGLADLDITDQPGSPGTDPARSGGIRPTISHQRMADAVVWTVMSGKDVAITMTAHLAPVDGGKRTKVTASVERGNAPDDYVSPAFRSNGTALSLFAIALEDELNELVAPVRADFAACEKLFQRFEVANYAAADLHSQDSLGDAVGDVSKMAVKLHAFEAESRRLGCEKYREGGFDEMVEADQATAHDRAAEAGGWGTQ